MNLFHICKKRARVAVEKWGTKTHFAYLAVATVIEGPVVLRITTGGCLVFCVLGEVLKDTEEVL